MLSGRPAGRAALIAIALFAWGIDRLVWSAPPPSPVDAPPAPSESAEPLLAQPVSQPSGAAPTAPLQTPGSMPADTPGSEVPLTEAPETTVMGQPSGVGGQGGAVSGDTQIETATRTSTPLSQVGSSVSVVTSEQMAQRKIFTVGEALRGLPGVDVVQTGPPGSATSIFIRGATSEQTKVLLDGMPMNDPITTGRLFDFSAMSIDNIERIEIIRGPQSVLYGSDAIGGVINIITKKGQGPLEKRFASMGGSFGTARESLAVSGGNSQVYSSWAGSYFDTRGFSAADVRMGNTERDAFHLGNLGGRMGWTPYRNFDVDFVFRMNQGNVNIDNGGGVGQDDPNAKNFTQQIFTRTQFRYQGPEQNWEQKFSFGTGHHSRQTKNPIDPMHPVDSLFATFNSLTQYIDWQHNIRLLENNTLTFGGVYQQEDGDSRFTSTSMFGPFDSVSPSRSLRDAAVYAQDQFNVADIWYTTFGTRQDHYSQAGTASTYRVTTLVRVPEIQTGWRGSIGTGFKAPTIYQLFDAFAGNPNLQSEESKGWDVGVEQPMFDGKMVLGATYFRNDFENLIDFNNVTFSYFNIGEAVSTGVELSNYMRLTENWDGTITYTHLDARDRVNNVPLLRRPRDRVGMIFNRKLLDSKANMNVSFFYVGQRFDRDFTQFPAPMMVLHKYIVVNAALTYNPTPRCQLFVRGDNLTNEVYQEAFGFGTAPISGYGGGSIVW